MAIDPNLTADAEIRILKIEKALSDLWRFMKACVDKGQFNALRTVRQQEYTTLASRVTDLETAYATLYNRVNNLL